MKAYSVSLQADVTGSYDKTKTTIAGLVAQKTINSKSVLGPPLTKFIDVFTDTLGGFLPGYMHLTPNGRLFVLMSAPATGILNQIAMYNFDLATGSTSYVGRIAFSIAAPATVSVRGFKVDDSSTSNMKIFLGLSSTSVTTGGQYMINKVATSDFSAVGFPTFYTAIANDVKGVYQLVSPVEIGGANLAQAATGISMPFNSSNSAINTKVYFHNGVSATHQVYAFDYSSAPSIASLGTSTVTSVNTTGASTTFTMVGNTLAVGDQVVITSNAPTGYSNTTNSTVQSIYFVVATNFVSGSTFSLSLTAGGAIVNASGTSTTTTFSRALGQCSNLFFGKTPNLPALTGTLLTTNSEDFAVPNHTANSGSDCVYWCTSSTQYLTKYTDFFTSQTGTTNGTITVTGLSSTSGLSVGQSVNGGGIPVGTTIATIVSGTSITLSAAATTSATATLVFGNNSLPSTVNSNVSGTGLDYLAITPLTASFSTYMDSAVFNVNGIFSLTKKFTNSVIQSSVGTASQIWLEGQMHPTDQFSSSTLQSLETRQGWLLGSISASIGQRGILAMHLGSDAIFDKSYIISPVQRRPNSLLVAIETLEELFDVTGGSVISYRGASTSTDSIFSSASGGWVQLNESIDYRGITFPDYFQFKINFTVSTAPGQYVPTISTPTQIRDLIFVSQGRTEMSDNWEFSYDDSSSGVPTRVGFNLRDTYVGSIPKLYFRAYDLNGNLVTQANTTDNAGNFQYSTDSGATWNSLGTIPNTANTRLRYTYTTPPGVDVRVAIQEV